MLIYFFKKKKKVWADNADGLSIPYSGTGALKTDFTRVGKRTRLGMLNDFNNSAIRYIKNNFLDGSRQDGFDLILGKYRVPSVYSHSPFKSTSSSIMIKLVPLYLFISLVLFLMILFSPDLFSIQSSLVHISILSFAFAVAVTCLLFIQQNGAEFVDWPKLIPLMQPEISDQSVLDDVGQLEAVQKASDMIHRWTLRRNSTAILNEAEQGYELVPPLKKTT